MEFPKVQTEVLSFSGNAEKLEYTLKLRFTPESGTPVEKSFLSSRRRKALLAVITIGSL